LLDLPSVGGQSPGLDSIRLRQTLLASLWTEVGLR